MLHFFLESKKILFLSVVCGFGMCYTLLLRFLFNIPEKKHKVRKLYNMAQANNFIHVIFFSSCFLKGNLKYVYVIKKTLFSPFLV